MGLSWGIKPPLNAVGALISLVLSFAVINLSSAIGAQANTISDIELDRKDYRKEQLVAAFDLLGRERLKTILAAESIFALVLASIFALLEGKTILLLMWIIGISLGCAYSLPPLRLKSRSWLAPITLMLVLAILPVLFAYYAFASEINLLFLLSLAGLAMVVYAVITPTEIRDYFGDKAMGIRTFTVRIGLVKASLLGIGLLSAGAVLTSVAYLLEWVSGGNAWLSLVLLVIPIPVTFVLTKFWMLYKLSREFTFQEDGRSIARRIVDLSARNPRWIMIVTQTFSAISIVLMLSKFLF